LIIDPYALTRTISSSTGMRTKGAESTSAMRIASAVALMFVLLGWGAIPTICQDTDIRGARAHSTITSVAVVEGADIIDVEVTFSELVQPAVRRLEHPDRLVFDFPGCDLAEMGQRFVVNRGSVMTVSTEAFGVARPGARVVIDLRTADLGSADLGSAQNRGRADSGNKLVVNLSAIGNKLIIELSTIELSSSHLSSTGGAGRPALGSGGNKPAANSQPLATASDRGTGPAVSKTAEVVPPMLNLPHIALQSDRVALKSVEVAPPMPNLPAVLGRDQVVLESAEVVAPMPTVPPPVPRSDRVVLRSPETVPPMPSLPPFLQSDRVVLPQSAEVVPPMQNVPSFDLRSNDLRFNDLRSDRSSLKPTVDAPRMPSLPPVLGRDRQIARTAPVQINAYALLDRARALGVSDLEPLEAKAKAGDAESETILALAYHAGTLLKMNDGEAVRLLQRAADRGFVAAEEAMGIFCQSGFGMPSDKAHAVAWYSKAARDGSTDAMTDLALMYSTGDGIPKDAAKAASWFQSAAEAGDATAQL